MIKLAQELITNNIEFKYSNNIILIRHKEWCFEVDEQLNVFLYNFETNKSEYFKYDNPNDVITLFKSRK